MTARMEDEPHELEATLVARVKGRDALDKAWRLATLDGYLLRRAATLHLFDRYFDTPSRALASRRIAVRVRESNGDVFLTVKGAGEAAPTGGTRRLEIEEPWSDQALYGALAALAAAGVRLDDWTAASATSDARTALELLGLGVVQERETERRVRLLTPEDSQRVLAEVDLDAVTYRFSDASARLFEIEIEAKDEPLELGRLVAALARELPELSPWPYSKLATGMAIERALSDGRELLDEDGAVSPAGWAALEDELAGQA
jgi:inorganic triphosphatase YgiF